MLLVFHWTGVLVYVRLFAFFHHGGDGIWWDVLVASIPLNADGLKGGAYW